MPAEKHDDHDELTRRLVNAYNGIMAHAAASLRRTRDERVRGVKHLLDTARDRAIELGDVTREEADKVTGYIQRDLVHAAEHMAVNRRDLSDWLRFDVQLLEQGVANVFEAMVDHTREALDDFAVRADVAGWKTGEIVGPGTLHCKNCQQSLHFHETGHIPPCPKCSHTAFAREHDLG